VLKNCLVLGAAGFIGQNLSIALSRRGVDVTGFDLGDRPPSVPASVSWVKGNFISGEEIEAALSGKDVVFHLVSTSVPASAQNDRLRDIKDNLLPTINLLDLCLKQKVRKIVFVSSGGTVYGRPSVTPIAEVHATNPISAYGVTKLAIEKYISMYSEVYGIESSILRLANPYGPLQHNRNNQGVISAFINRVRKGEKVEIWGDGQVVRDYIYIDDVCDALVRAGENGRKISTYNIGSGRGHALLEVLRVIESVTGIDASVEFLAPRAVDVPTNVLDIEKARLELSWQPKFSLQDGVRLTDDWLSVHSH